MYAIPDSAKGRVSVVTIGNINNPLGLWSRLGFLPTIPGLDISFNPQLPTDIGIKSTNYSFEYDPVGDAPQYWGNPLTMLNALFAFESVHGYYLDPTSNSPNDSLPYGYDNGTLATATGNAPHRVSDDATFVLIPQQGALPLYQPIVGLGKQLGLSALVNPLVALVNPVTKLLVDLGYDRVTDPGIARTLSILPFNPFAINPVDFSVKFVAAIVQGIKDALAGGVSLTPATTPVTPPSTLVARNVAPQTVDPVENKKVAAVVNTTAVGTDLQSASDEPKVTESGEPKATDQNVDAKAAADTVAADAQIAVDAADAQAAAAKEAAEAKAAADAKDAADKADADKAAADKAAADKLKDAKDAADKQQDDAAKAAADKAKEASDNAKAAGAAGNGQATKVAGVDTGTAAPAKDAGAGDSEKQAA